jgi:hypothetical protein
MNEHLSLITHPCIRYPDARKSIFYHQLQNMVGITLVGLLLAHIAGTNLGGVAYPHLVAQPFQKLHKPLAIAHRLHANEGWRAKPTIELLCLSCSVHQLPLITLAALSIESCYLLKTWMKITSDYDHLRLLAPAQPWSPNQPKFMGCRGAFVLI